MNYTGKAGTMRLENKVAIVTGSTSGIGRAIAKAMAVEGAIVAVNGRRAEAAEEVAREIRGAGGKAVAMAADVTQAAQVQGLVKGVLEAFGRIDVLINNAGGVGGVRPTRYMEEILEEEWDRVVDLNLKAAFLCSRAVTKQMREQGGGKIVNTASEAARRIHRGESGRFQYTAAKAGLVGLTRAMAIELGPYGINVNAVAPGYTLANERHRSYWASLPPEEKEKVVQDIPLRRLAEPEDIAPVAVFLASDEARYINGATIDVNGGRTVS